LEQYRVSELDKKYEKQEIKIWKKNP
jgi:hypothetical protein